MASGSKTVIYAALVGNLLIAVTKFAAAAFTGSAAMMAEGIHSTVDTGNQGLLLYGLRRAKRPPDGGEASPVVHGDAMRCKPLLMGAGAIPHIGLPAIARVVYRKAKHDGVALLFRYHRRGGDAEAAGISPDHGLRRQLSRRHLVAVDQHLCDFTKSGGP